MTGTEKVFDLEERTFNFARDVRSFVKLLPRSAGNLEDIKQLVRSSGSVGANYIEANESLSKKDFAMRIKIARKEAKESRYWLKLLEVGNGNDVAEKRRLLEKEAMELTMILSAILRKSTN